MSLFDLHIESTTIIAYINSVKSRDAYDDREWKLFSINSNIQHLRKTSNLLHRVENSTVQWTSHSVSQSVSCSNMKTKLKSYWTCTDYIPINFKTHFKNFNVCTVHLVQFNKCTTYILIIFYIS